MSKSSSCPKHSNKYIYKLGWHTCMSWNYCDNWKKWKWTICIDSESLIKCVVQGTTEYCLCSLYRYIVYKLTYKLWLWKIISAVAEYMYKSYKRWWLSKYGTTTGCKTSLLYWSPVRLPCMVTKSSLESWQLHLQTIL